MGHRCRARAVCECRPDAGFAQHLLECVNTLLRRGVVVDFRAGVKGYEINFGSNGANQLHDLVSMPASSRAFCQARCKPIPE